MHQRTQMPPVYCTLDIQDYGGEADIGGQGGYYQVFDY